MESKEFPQTPLTPLDSISIEEAMAWTDNWQKLFPTQCKAFLIPLADVINLLEELHMLKKQDDGSYIRKDPKGKNAAIRAYMAIGDSDGDGYVEEKLVMVAAIEEIANSNIYIDQVAKAPKESMIALSGSGAFDFTSPCPSDCDPTSPLNHN